MLAADTWTCRARLHPDSDPHADSIASTSGQAAGTAALELLEQMSEAEIADAVTTLALTMKT
jgi:hypothetical protein